ncbi:MAG: type IV toxin-antitoxin system AbiEi family antitoxin domain-containing protein [Ignavibacteriae bacterium]|nr:type IV toxin-antitoxin system AbiEi family antitoxin domain-containing protein [Ignavibacteriota bacterium]
MKHSTAGINLLRHLAHQGLKIFTIGQAQETARQEGINPGYVAEALHHLLKGKWIIRLKRGVYAFSIHSGFGPSPHEFEVSQALIPYSAISHWTAMHYHHLTQQTPNKIFSITPTTTSIPRSIGKGMYHFIKIKKEYYFGIEKVWIGEAQIQITNPERTLLDGLMAPQYCGDFQEVLQGFKMLGNKMNLERMVAYSLRLNQATVKRLGWILEKLGTDELSLKQLLQLPTKGYRKLDPCGPLKGPYNKKWMIQENIGIS